MKTKSYTERIAYVLCKSTPIPALVSRQRHSPWRHYFHKVPWQQWILQFPFPWWVCFPDLIRSSIFSPFDICPCVHHYVCLDWSVLSSFTFFYGPGATIINKQQMQRAIITLTLVYVCMEMQGNRAGFSLEQGILCMVGPKNKAKNPQPGWPLIVFRS